MFCAAFRVAGWMADHSHQSGRLPIGRATGWKRTASSADRELVSRAGVASCVRFDGYLDHGAAVASLRSADLLFLPMHDLPAGERARIVPGKTYEYLGARRPILAAVPAGDARDFVLASGLGQVCAPGDCGAMRKILEMSYARWKGQEAAPTIDDDFIRRFERSNLTRSLAAVLDAVATGGPLQQTRP